VIVTETRVQALTSNRSASDLFACKWIAGPRYRLDQVSLKGESISVVAGP